MYSFTITQSNGIVLGEVNFNPLSLEKKYINQTFHSIKPEKKSRNVVFKSFRNKLCYFSSKNMKRNYNH